MFPTLHTLSPWEPTPEGWSRSQALRALRKLLGLSGSATLDGGHAPAVRRVDFNRPEIGEASKNIWSVAPPVETLRRIGRFTVATFPDGSGLCGLCLDDELGLVVLPALPFVGPPSERTLESVWTAMPTFSRPLYGEPQGVQRLFPDDGWRGPDYHANMLVWTQTVSSLRSVFQDLPQTLILRSAYAHASVRCTAPNPEHLNTHPHHGPLLDALTGLARHLFPGGLGYRQAWNTAVVPGEPRDPRAGRVLASTLTGSGGPLSAHARLALLEFVFSFHPSGKVPHGTDIPTAPLVG